MTTILDKQQLLKHLAVERKCFILPGAVHQGQRVIRVGPREVTNEDVFLEVLGERKIQLTGRRLYQTTEE